MKYTHVALSLFVLVVIHTGCGHQAINRTGGRISLVADDAPSTSFVIERKALHEALAKGASQFIRQVGVRPVVTSDERFFGFQVMSLFPEWASAETLPVRVGDIIQTVNGRSIERPEQFMAVWESLASASYLSLQLVRDREQLMVTWLIRDTHHALSAALP